MVMTFCIVIGILLGALLCALVLWIVEAVRLGYTPTAKPEKRSEQQIPQGANDSSSRTDGIDQPHDSAEAIPEKPQGP